MAVKDWDQKQRERDMGLDLAKKTKTIPPNPKGVRLPNSIIEEQEKASWHYRKMLEAQMSSLEEAQYQAMKQQREAKPYLPPYIVVHVERDYTNFADKYVFRDQRNGRQWCAAIDICYSPSKDEYRRLEFKLYAEAERALGESYRGEEAKWAEVTATPEPMKPKHREGHFPTHWIMEAIDRAETSDMAITFGIEREGIMVMAMSENEKYSIRVTNWEAMENEEENPLLPAIEDVERKLALLIKMKDVAA
jgi:hypothetical protein